MPGKEDELHSMMTNIEAKVQQARVDRKGISGWYFYKLLSPSGSIAEYDYMTVTVINGYKNIFDSSIHSTMH